MNYGISILFRAIPLVMALFCFGYGAFIYGYGDAGGRVVAGPVVFSLGMISIATIITGICIFSGADSTSAFVAGHVITGVGFITGCVATAATSSTRFSFIPGNSKSTGHEVPKGAFSLGEERTMEAVVITISLVAWIWAFVLLANSHVHPAYFVAGHVMVGLACICTSLIALVATIARQIRNVYSEKERSQWPKLVLLMGSLSFIWGLFVIFADSGSTNGTSQPHSFDSGTDCIGLLILGCICI